MTPDMIGDFVICWLCGTAVLYGIVLVVKEGIDTLNEWRFQRRVDRMLSHDWRCRRRSAITTEEWDRYEWVDMTTTLNNGEHMYQPVRERSKVRATRA